MIKAKDEYCMCCGKYHPKEINGCQNPSQEFLDAMIHLERSDEVIEYPEIDFEDLLCKYGPEGLYDIANKLKDIANKDVSDSIQMNSIKIKSIEIGDLIDANIHLKTYLQIIDIIDNKYKIQCIDKYGKHTIISFYDRNYIDDLIERNIITIIDYKTC